MGTLGNDVSSVGPSKRWACLTDTEAAVLDTLRPLVLYPTETIVLPERRSVMYNSGGRVGTVRRESNKMIRHFGLVGSMVYAWPIGYTEGPNARSADSRMM